MTYLTCKAKAGDPTAQAKLGWAYYEGTFGKKDLVSAVQWLRKAVSQGSPLGQNFLGALYDRGEGVGKDPIAARELYEKAAASNDPHGTHNLIARLLESSPTDVDRGLRLAEDAVLRDIALPETMELLALEMLKVGTNRTKDSQPAVALLTRAAEKGLSRAQYNLAVLNYNGQFVPFNEQEARKWFEKAAAGGYEDAKRALAVFHDGKVQDVAPKPAQASAEQVAPAKLMSLPQDYVNRRVAFTVRVSGRISNDGKGRSRVYIDDHRYLTPILRDEVLRRWIDANLDLNRMYIITFIGRVSRQSIGTYVDFDVEDFQLN